jgi:hypothetical protein
MTGAFGAFLGIDDVDPVFFPNRDIGTFRLASGTAGTLGSDDFVCHDFLLTVKIGFYAAAL